MTRVRLGIGKVADMTTRYVRMLRTVDENM